MAWLQSILKFLDGKKTYLGVVAGSALLMVWGIDAGLHDDLATEAVETTWFTFAQYAAAAAAIFGWTGVSVRHTAGKIIDSNNQAAKK